MVTFDDCVGLSDLTPDEISAIAEHEHLPEMQALELGCYLEHEPDGAKQIKSMIADDIRIAKATGHVRHARELREVLRHYVDRHPEVQSAKALHRD